MGESDADERHYGFHGVFVLEGAANVIDDDWKIFSDFLLGIMDDIGREDFVEGLRMAFGVGKEAIAFTKLLLHHGNLELVKFLYESGAPITPSVLSWCILHKCEEISSWLLSFDFDFASSENAPNPTRRAPIQAAAEVGDIDLLERLLQRGADVNTPAHTHIGATALQLAAIQGFFGLVQKLLGLGADPNAPGAETLGRTALEGAAERGRLDTVQLLLNAGVETEGNGRRQYVRAIAFANEQGHFAVAKLLKLHRPWTEQDQTIMDDEDLLNEDQTPEAIAQRESYFYDTEEDFEEDFEEDLEEEFDEEFEEDFEGEFYAEVSEENTPNDGRQPPTTSPSNVSQELEQEVSECDKPVSADGLNDLLPSSIFDAIQGYGEHGEASMSNPGDEIWAEAFENLVSEFPWTTW
ncbi:Ankyrin-1-like protein 2 [Colletotrichum chlorophyti]|uniref:Ankyrin-1-like protein 2 n=1 Tax=Colletotrichum chlorophyti TaxID=708187 RepID=A0A1Q8S5K0_9PEZI|nr:Ankyrin-1-like protein 2 [Colletotrichum chlorophyti]